MTLPDGLDIGAMKPTPADEVSVEPTSLEPWLFLLGRPPVDEFLSFLVGAAGTQEVDLVGAAERWRQAAAVTDRLAASEAGAADQIEIRELPHSLRGMAEAHLAKPAIASSYVLSPPQVALVPLDGLVVFQRQINLRYASELRELIGDWEEDSPQLLNFCLAIDQPEPPIAAAQVNANTFVFSSVSTDARFLGARLLPAAEVHGRPAAGRPTAAIALDIGYGANAINVLGYNGRWVLHNGSHRAYALRSRGFTYAPAITQVLSRPDDLASIPAVQQNTSLYLGHPRPPILRDYFNEEVTETVGQGRRVRQIRIQFGVDPLDAPG